MGHTSVCGPVICYAFGNLAQPRGARRRESISKKVGPCLSLLSRRLPRIESPDFREVCPIPLPRSRAMESVIQVAV